MPPNSCAVPGRNPGHVDEGHQRDIEAVAKAHETGRFDRRVDIQASGQHRGLVGDDSDRISAHARESNQHVLGVVFLDFEEMPVIDHPQDDLAHVVGLVGILGNDRVQRLVAAVGVILGRLKGRVLEIVRRHVGEHLAHRDQGALIVGHIEMADSGAGRMGIGAAQFLHRHFLMSRGLDDVGSGDEHVGAVLHHHDEVGHRRANRPRRRRRAP